MASERRLAAIMFTDIVGYTRMAQANESLTLDLLEEHRKIVRLLFPPHGGTEVKTIGDAFLVEFRSALEAVLCAVEIQEKFRERNSSVPPDRRVEVRVGIHLGDVVYSSGDVVGDAVNVASRIEPLADPGGICISQQVYDNIRNKTEFDLTKLGNIELKNVELPMGVYRIEMSRAGAITESHAPKERLAVLPFVNISPDPNDEFFADGLTEELITKLSEVKGLKVIARTSVMNYKKKEKNISDIGRELGVGSIIEGSVRKAGNKIRVSVQLVDSRTEEHLWASNYDKQLDDIFAIQSDVATKVAESAGLILRPKAKETKDVEAYALYLRGSQLLHGKDIQTVRESVDLFKRAIRRDPNFARAYAGLALAYLSLCYLGVEEWDSVTENVEPFAKKAVELDPNLAEGHAALASVSSALDRFSDAVAHASEAVRLNPNLAESYATLGIVKATMGDLEGARGSLEKAYELDPLSIWMGGHLALVSLTLGDVNRAKEVRQGILDIDPNNPRGLAGMAEFYMVTGDFSKAQEMLDRGRVLDAGDPIVRLDQGVLFALEGKRSEAQRVLDDVQSIKVGTARLYGNLFINAALGNLDAAFEVLNQQAELHSWPFMIGSLPVFAELRKDPRYNKFAAKVGLPPAK